VAMSGKRLLDAIQIFNVTKSVVLKHFVVRQQQFEIYIRTSSLTKGVKSQADDVIATAQAAAALAKRFNEPVNPSLTESLSQTQPSSDESIQLQRNPSSSGDTKNEHKKDETGDLSSITPEGVDETPLPTAQSEKFSSVKASGRQEISYSPSHNSSPDSSAYSNVKVPESTGYFQGGKPLTTAGETNTDVSRSVSEPKAAREPKSISEPDSPSEDMMRELFHSPKVANILLSNKHPAYSKNAPLTFAEPAGMLAQRDKINSGSQGKSYVSGQNVAPESSRDPPVSASIQPADGEVFFTSESVAPKDKEV
jgi:aarF domain-containing kinase